MTKTLESTINYYRNYEEETRLFRDHAHKVEFLTTTHYIDKLIKTNDKIIEVGAGTGAYSFYYADKGMDVTAVELVDRNVEIMKQNQSQHNPIEVIQGDARNLSMIKESQFDTVLCLGPLYHLSHPSDQKACIKEMVRILKPGGILLVAYISNYMAFVNHVASDPTYLTQKKLVEFLESGKNEENCFNFLSPEQAENLLSNEKITIKNHIATDGLSYLLRDKVNCFTDEQFTVWFDYHLKTCEEPSLLGYSCHGLLIVEKVVEHKE
ncbi:class I SAM-dependent methyltransferase [Haloplasma contractile]|uniref:Ubiquinone-menaquinone biosynthesis methyltransferase protein n=1 Tax=Haloplasma contractile SSD-17B TaxID=1033810 RepID=F7PRC0_9MOLU|nr:class I SAM-dependent methyltransferase [Haloplasma contractile]ERJ11754.1 Ubiquinone-menaquinone biosynthesis methyltransferase protein [Haloplasma contractile SSD-17B]